MALPSSVTTQHPDDTEKPRSPPYMHSPIHNLLAQRSSSPSTPTASCTEVMEDYVLPEPPSTSKPTLDNDKTACIVCLVDLPETSSDFSTGDNFDQIARLIPCNHAMHNSCLAPWVERANSCPICRQSFNKVKLSNTLLGLCPGPYSTHCVY